MSQCEGPQQGQAQLLSPCLLPAASSPSGFVLLLKGLCPCPGKSPTRESSFPVAMAIADSKQPVVEKVQQLPQAPCMRNGTGAALGGAEAPQPPQTPGHRDMAGGHSLHSPRPCAQPCPGARRARSSSGGAPWGTCPQPSAPRWPWHTLLTWFFTGVTKFPFFLQSMESG